MNGWYYLVGVMAQPVATWGHAGERGDGWMWL